jgi:hypothetical protein
MNRLVPGDGAFGGDTAGFTDFLGHLGHDFGVADWFFSGEDGTRGQSELHRVFLPVEVQNHLICCHEITSADFVHHKLN